MQLLLNMRCPCLGRNNAQHEPPCTPCWLLKLTTGRVLHWMHAHTARCCARLCACSRLAQMMSGIACKINLIEFNPHEGTQFLPSLQSDVATFKSVLIQVRDMVDWSMEL